MVAWQTAWIPDGTTAFRGVEVPGQRVTSDTLKTVVMRYVTAGEMAPGRRVLELGCGPGIGLEYLKERGAARVVGADRDAGLLHSARSRTSSGVALTQCDASCLPFRSDSFDVVFLLELLMYLTEPVAVLREVRRVLGRYGSVLLSMPNAESLGALSGGGTVRFHSCAEVGGFLREAGFVPEMFGAFPIPAGVKARTARQRSASRVLDGLERCGFPHRWRMRLTSAVLGKNHVLPMRIQEEHRRFLAPDDADLQLLYGNPENCRVLYARGELARG